MCPALFRNAASEMIDLHRSMTAEEHTKAESAGLNMLSSMCDAKDELDGKSQLSREGVVAFDVFVQLSLRRDYRRDNHISQYAI